MSDLTIPGSVAGLLRRGAPVVTTMGARAVFLGAFGVDGMWAYAADTGHMGWGTSFTRDPADLSLDLSDPLGCDVAARWVAEKVGAKSGVSAPEFRRVHVGRSLFVNGAIVAIFILPGERQEYDGSRVHVVPALAAISLTDPNADVLALIAVVRHLSAGWHIARPAKEEG